MRNAFRRSLPHARGATGYRLGALASFVALMSLPVAPAHAVDPGAEYGPEAEARFLEICMDGTEARFGACLCLSEGLQQALGYPAYLAIATGGPPAFATAEDVWLTEASRHVNARCNRQVVVEVSAAR